MDETAGRSPAKITDRFLAYLVDTLPFVAGFYSTLFLLIRVWRLLPDSPAIAGRVLAGWGSLYVLYLWVSNWTGETFGKQLLGIRVERMGSGPLGPGRALLRAVGVLLSTPLCNLGYLWAFVQSDSRTWHDLLAGSWVVEAGPKTREQSVRNALLAFVALGLVVIGGARYHFSRPTFSDRVAVEKAQEGLRVLARIEESYRARHGTYTDRLTDLALESGDGARFRDAMHGIFDPDYFRIQAASDRYVLSARARDRRRTVVSMAGP
ncbi:MAG: RDD family protein [Elusimicrobia bacterium]|nr:RDD family protein [Elusimicrobiota bacterium]